MEWKWKSLSCIWLCDPRDYTVSGILQARILGWVGGPFSRESSQPKDRTQVSHIAGGFFTHWATMEGANLQSWRVTSKSPAKIENTFIDGKRSWEGGVNKAPWFFIGWVLARKEEEPFSFLLGLAVITGCESSPYWSPNSNLGFCVLVLLSEAWNNGWISVYLER